MVLVREAPPKAAAPKAAAGGEQSQGESSSSSYSDEYGSSSSKSESEPKSPAKKDPEPARRPSTPIRRKVRRSQARKHIQPTTKQGRGGHSQWTPKEQAATHRTAALASSSKPYQREPSRRRADHREHRPTLERRRERHSSSRSRQKEHLPAAGAMPVASRRSVRREQSRRRMVAKPQEGRRDRDQRTQHAQERHGEPLSHAQRGRRVEQTQAAARRPSMREQSQQRGERRQPQAARPQRPAAVGSSPWPSPGQATRRAALVLRPNPAFMCPPPLPPPPPPRRMEQAVEPNTEVGLVPKAAFTAALWSSQQAAGNQVQQPTVPKRKRGARGGKKVKRQREVKQQHVVALEAAGVHASSPTYRINLSESESPSL